MTISLEIEDGLLKRAKLVAAEHGLTLDDLVNRGLRRELQALRTGEPMPQPKKIDLTPLFASKTAKFPK